MFASLAGVNVEYEEVKVLGVSMAWSHYEDSSSTFNIIFKPMCDSVSAYCIWVGGWGAAYL